MTAYGSSRQLLMLRCCVAPYLLLLFLVVVLVIVGDDAAGDDARAGSPRTDEFVVLRQTGQLQGFIRRWGQAPTTATGNGGGRPALNRQQAAAAGGGGGRRMLVGSRAPTTCTYNECRGCRHRCRVQAVPIDASDPINSAYHYKCICHL